MLVALTMSVSATVSARSHSAKSTDAEKKFTVVVDAGHGGKDYGCIGDKTNEKTITLDVAKRLCDKINAEQKDIKTVMTREADCYLTLQERADIANRAEGDLFISIHVNSVDKKSKGRKSVKGTSVYALGADKSAKNLGVAMRENAVIELEKDYSESYRGFDPASSESYIIFELSNDLHLSQSLSFADMAQHQLVNYAGRADKGVRQAGFWVLWATSMPAVLVELDFICNPEQEKFLNSESGREKCAEAIYRALKKYHEEYKKTTKATH